LEEKKSLDSSFHPNSHGGNRNPKLTEFEHQKIRGLLWLLAKEDPTRKLRSYVEEVNKNGFSIGREFVRKIFKEWQWSWKKPSYKQLHKYLPSNLRRYKEYVEWIGNQDLKKIKFMDEVHYVSKQVSHTRALGEIGENVILLRTEHFAETYSFTCLCSLDEVDPIFITAKETTTDQSDFFHFVIKCITSNRLKPGDTLVCDNCSIHSGSETWESLMLILDTMDIDLRYLPPYSPEFNPCELVFAQSKHYLRNYRCASLPLHLDIAASFAIVTYDNVKSYYQKCCT